MKITESDLRANYESFETARLLELRVQGTLTELASRVLEQVLAERFVTAPEIDKETAELKERLERNAVVVACIDRGARWSTVDRLRHCSCNIGSDFPFVDGVSLVLDYWCNSVVFLLAAGRWLALGPEHREARTWNLRYRSAWLSNHFTDALLFRYVR